MQTIILAGGLGSRITEETVDKPKPLVTIGEKPILEHLLDIYTYQNFNDFIISGGYKVEKIFEWAKSLPKTIKIQVVDSGIQTQTGGRIKFCEAMIIHETFLATYGDGLANININELVAFHKSHGKLVTLTAVRPPARFGSLSLQGELVTEFGEKVQANEGWINGGFFVIQKEALKYIRDLSEPFESGALPTLARNGQLMAFKHSKFWKPMDTLREKLELESLLKLRSVPPWLEDLQLGNGQIHRVLN